MFPPDLQQTIQQWHQQHKKIVLVTGVFDILHQEHRAFLTKAKQAGDVLFIGIESDSRVKKIKGPDRPINSAPIRQQNLAALNLADAVFVMPDDFYLPERRQELLDQLKPAILAVSSHTDHLEAKRAIMANIGGEVQVVHQHNPEVSSTILLQRQRD